jgi:release factor glutamine methyltransferase
MEHSDDSRPAHRPRMSKERAEQLRRWHDDALKSGRRPDAMTATVLGRTFLVPPEVYPPNPLGLAEMIPEEVRETDRVLDMGTGSGVNGIIAASKSRRVVAVDVNPIAVVCARENAERNGVGEGVEVRESDLFQNVSGRFDLILFDPPFRWFHPRDLYERATADENYETLTSFFRQVSTYLTGHGRILLSFGTTGDIDYLRELVAQAGLQTEELRRVEGEKDGLTVAYLVYRFTIDPRPV